MNYVTSLKIKRSTPVRIERVRVNMAQVAYKFISLRPKRFTLVRIFASGTFNHKARMLLEELSGLHLRTVVQLRELQRCGYDVEIDVVGESLEDVRIWSDVNGLSLVDFEGAQIVADVSSIRDNPYQEFDGVTLDARTGDEQYQVCVFRACGSSTLNISIESVLRYPAHTQPVWAYVVAGRTELELVETERRLPEMDVVTQARVAKSIAEKVLKAVPLIIASARVSHDAKQLVRDIIACEISKV